MSVLSKILAAMCFLGGVVNCWYMCYTPTPDGIHYLNIGEALFRHDFTDFFETTWGPLIGILYVTWLKLGPGAWLGEREAIEVLNLLILLAVIACCAALERRILSGQAGGATTPFRCGTSILTYGALWIALGVLGVFRQTPDLLLTVIVLASALIYLATFEDKPARVYRHAILMGVCCAAGYYLKQSYLPVGLLFIAALALAPAQPKLRWLRVSAAAGTFLILLLPWIAGLSLRAGHLNLGENARLNYFLYVEQGNIFDAVPRGTDRGAGTHLSLAPDAVDFGNTFPRAQYPLQFDAGWYVSKLPIAVTLRGQIVAGLPNYAILVNLFRHKGPFGLLVVLGLMLLASIKYLSALNRWVALLGISAVPFALYPLVHIEYRYVAPYLLLGSIALWGWLASSRKSMPPLWMWLASGGLLAGILWDQVKDPLFSQRDEYKTYKCCQDPYQRFRDEMRAGGVADGSRLALLGEPQAPYFYVWLRPGGYRLQAVVTKPEELLGATPEAREKLDEELARTGSEALLAPKELVPAAQLSSWTPLSIGYVFRKLGKGSATATEAKPGTVRVQ